MNSELIDKSVNLTRDETKDEGDDNASPLLSCFVSTAIIQPELCRALGRLIQS